MNQRQFILSFAIHFVLIAGFLFWSPLKPKKPTDSITISIVNSGLQDSRHAMEASSVKSKSEFKRKSLQENGLLFPKANEIITESLKNPNLYRQKIAWDNSQTYSEDLSSDTTTLNQKELKFMRSLWQQIDNSIVDNPYLSEYGHFGKVYLTFVIDAEGRIDESSIRANARDGILKVIAMRAVRKALRNEMNELQFPSEKLQVAARFSWSDYKTCKLLKGTHRNTLSFCKYAEDKRKTFSPDEKALTYLSALQYGFGAGEEIEKYNKEQARRELKFDPFDEYRRDPDFNI